MSLDEPAYSYVLGMYLGDGHLHWTGWTYQMKIHLDLKYPRVIEDCASAMQAVVPGPNVYRRYRNGWNVVALEMASKDWLPLIPQFGRGRKHLRPIVLADWQQDIVERHTEQFLRGLIHSDGCRTVNRFKTTLPSGRVAEYAYPRYFFSNLSADIRGLFCEGCERLGVRWTQSNHRNISVSHRASVARLDEFIGPKE